MTKSYFNEYNDIISNTIIPLHLKNLKNSFNQLTVKYIDYLSNNPNEEDSIIYLNELIEKYQNISFCSKKLIKYYNEYSTSKNINNQLYTYHIYLILDFLSKVYDISSNDLLLLIINNNILDERIKDKYQLDFIHYIIFRMIIFKEQFDYMKYAKELGYEEQSMTTNGFFLEKMAESLKDSGLSRINVSLDTMDREKFKNIVGIDSLDRVISGIEKMLETSDCLIKINMVVMKDNLNEVTDFIKYAIKQNEKSKLFLLLLNKILYVFYLFSFYYG